MAEPTFDRAAFDAALGTRRLGRVLEVHAALASTNDAAWEAWARGAPHGTAIVTDAQTAGRGRAGRTWHTAPGRGLAMSVLLTGVPRDRGPTLPLAAGLALVRALAGLGAGAELKWPNDTLLDGRKVAGLLCESRAASGTLAIVIGAGVNVGHTADELPPDLRESATSLAIAGSPRTREEVAAGFLNVLEPLLDPPASPAEVVRAWRERAHFWGRPVTVRTATGAVTGIARDLDASGALVLETASGPATVHAGDLDLAAGPR